MADGSITRCFSSGQLRELLTEAGLEVEWVGPRTVLSPSTVDHVLAADSRALTWLVDTELDAQPDDDDTVGHPSPSARRRACLTASAPALAPGLALHAAGGLGARLEPARGHGLAAVRAEAVVPVVHPLERREHRAALPLATSSMARLRSVSVRSVPRPPRTGPTPPAGRPPRTPMDRSSSASMFSRRLRAVALSTDPHLRESGAACEGIPRFSRQAAGDEFCDGVSP